MISVSLRHKAPQTKIKQMSFILKWPTGNVSLSSHLALLRSKVTSSSSNPGFLPSKTPPPGCELWSPDSVTKNASSVLLSPKMSTEWVCHFNNYYIWLLFFSLPSERRAWMLASCSLCFSDFGKQIGYCRWILGRWQNSSTRAGYLALTALWRKNTPRGKFLLLLLFIVTSLKCHLIQAMLEYARGRFGRRGKVCRRRLRDALP